MPRSGLPAETLAKAGGEMENKKFIIIGVGVLLLIVLLVLFAVSSCGKKSNNNQPTTNTLTIWTTEDDEKAFQGLIDNFQSKNKGIKVEFVKKSSKEYLTEALNKIAAGEGPDIWAIPNDWLPMYSDKLVPMPTEKLENKKEKKSAVEVYKEIFPSVVSQDNIISDQIYGMPLAIDSLILYINTDTFSQVLGDYQRAHIGEDIGQVRLVFSAGPKNWDEFVQVVRLITNRSGSQIDRSAVALGTPGNVNQSVDILTLLMLQNGTKMTSDDFSTAQFATKQNVFDGVDFPGTKALEFFTSFANPGNENYTWNSSMPDSLHAFAEGKTAMMIDYASQTNELKNINSKLMYKTIAIPQIKETKNPVNYTSYLTFTVTKASKNSSLAWDFINQFSQKNLTSKYISVTKKASALSVNVNSSLDTVAVEARTAQSWFKPDPEKSDNIFLDMIKQANDGLNSQTAIENAASQITTLLGKLKQ